MMDRVSTVILLGDCRSGSALPFQVTLPNYHLISGFMSAIFADNLLPVKERVTTYNTRKETGIPLRH